MLVLLDTNVLLRSAVPQHPQQPAAVTAVSMLRRDGHEPVIVPQVLYEFWSVATRPVSGNGLGLSPSDAQSELVNIQRLFRFLRDERSVYKLWEQLVTTLGVKGKPAHDARLVAAMQRHGIFHLLTFNVQDFQRYAVIQAVAPDQIANGLQLR